MNTIIKTYEVDLNTKNFDQLSKNNYIIIKNNNIKIGDYILFRKTEFSENGDMEYTDLFMMTQVIDIVTGEGLVENYSLFIVTKL